MAQNKSSGGAAGFAAANTSNFENALPAIQSLLMVTPHIQAAMMRALIKQQRELFSFIGQRCEEDLKLVEQIGAATTMPDMFSACLGFCKDAALQYAEEAGKVTEMGSDGAIQAVSNIQEQAKVVTEMMQPEAA